MGKMGVIGFLRRDKKERRKQTHSLIGNKKGDGVLVQQSRIVHLDRCSKEERDNEQDFPEVVCVQNGQVATLTLCCDTG